VRDARCRIVYVLEASLRLLHPLMPYLTEELWQRLPHRGDSIMMSEWPKADPPREDHEAREQMETLIAVITKVRNIRSEMNIPTSGRLKLHVGAGDLARSLIEGNAESIRRLARVEEISFHDSLPPLESAARDVVAGVELLIPLGGLIDFKKERDRVTKEITRKENEARGMQARLDNPSFAERAPAEVVEQTRGRHAELMAEIEKLRATLETLKQD
jgi:valyl-tRNA synthetase